MAQTQSVIVMASAACGLCLPGRFSARVGWVWYVVQGVCLAFMHRIGSAAKGFGADGLCCL